MKSLGWIQNKQLLFRVLLFVVIGVFISLLIPIKKSSRYQYTKDKPWQGELLTAPYDFPIYKTDEQWQREQDSITRSQRPVYKQERDVAMLMMQEFQDEYRARMRDSVPGTYFSYVNEQLQIAYKDGIIEFHDDKQLNADKVLEVFLMKDGNELERIPTSKFRTPKEILERIIQGVPEGLDRDVVRSMNIQKFIRTNVTYDDALTQKLINEAVTKLSRSSGMVQMGQRIIDKGEIVSPQIYNQLRSLEKEEENRAGGTMQMSRIRIGVLIMSVVAMLILSLYLSHLVRRYSPSQKNNLLILISIAVFTFLTSITTYKSWIDVYVIPYVMVVILLRIFLDSYTALLSFIVTILLSALFVTDPLSFILIQLLAGMGALVSLQKLKNRGKMIRAAFIVYLIYSLTYLGMFLIADGEFSKSFGIMYLYFGINLIFLTFTYVLSAVIERLFGFVSNVSLVELGDIDTPLLRELSEVAPGTFQHSIQVSILAAEATDKIGGDVSLARIGALYHDIGKIIDTEYFTENQGGVNPHGALSPKESADIIIRHVTNGIALAQKHNLPTPIIDFIRTHHADGLVKYFYTVYCNEHLGEEVDITSFQYPGPKPFTREQGILMLADSTEASSRSLKEYTVETITSHVNRIVDGIIAEGHLNDTPLTFKDIQVIKEVFISKLKTMYHTRISYPNKQ